MTVLSVGMEDEPPPPGVDGDKESGNKEEAKRKDGMYSHELHSIAEFPP